MFSKEESQRMRQEFWTSFGKSFPTKWTLYNTKIKGFSFKFYFDTKKAMVLVEIDAVGEMGDTAHGKVVLGGADEAQGDVGLAAVQVGECGITLNDKTYIVVFAVEIGNVGHQQESGDEWRCGNDDAVPQLGLFARGTLQHAHIFADFAGMTVKSFAFGGEQVAFADVVKQAQAECVFQLGDLPRNGAVLHVQVFGSGGKGLFFHEGGEVADAVPVPIHTTRSEERRVGKECRSRWSPYH